MMANTIILICVIFAAVWTVMTRSLLRAGIGLALTSAILSIVMFRLNSPMAAALELSVCAGFISVVFISTISLTQPLTRQDIIQAMKDKFSRFWPLPLLLLAVVIILNSLHIKPDITLPAAEREQDVGVVLWHLRKLDLIGQVLVILAGIFGVAVLFKETRKK